MQASDLDFFKVLFENLDPRKFPETFLRLLLQIQNVERGSLWTKHGNGYLCIEALGRQADTDTGAGSQPLKGTRIPADRSSVVGWVMENGRMTVAEAGKDPRHFQEMEKGMEIKSTLILCFPLILKNGQVYGAVEIIDTSAGGKRLNLDEGFLDLLQSLVDCGSLALGNALNYSRQLEKNIELEQALQKVQTGAPIIGQSRPFLEVMKKVREYARTDFPVLITGESGTGKDLIALALHDLSSRRDRPFVVQNCSAIPETLLESELFGYKKGAFTGATRDKVGLLESADGGTVFLDEIGDMSPQLQARILRVLQNSEIKPVGETRTKTVNVRIISATNRDLGEAIAAKAFREDLFYRINVLPIHLPPLRERRKDIPLLLNAFLRRESHQLGMEAKKLSNEALQCLMDYPWEGNIRELQNFVKYMLSTADKEILGLNDIPDHFRQESTGRKRPPEALAGGEEEKGRESVPSPDTEPALFQGRTWEEMEKAYVDYLLRKNKWNVSKAARDAGIKRSTFDSRMKKLGIAR